MNLHVRFRIPHHAIVRPREAYPVAEQTPVVRLGGLKDDLATSALLDPHGGVSDLARHTLRFLHPPNLRVGHAALALAIGFGGARRVEGEEGLWEALQTFTRERSGPTLRNVAMAARDASDVLRNLTSTLGKKVRAGVAEN
jgi:hypothetical protein